MEARVYNLFLKNCNCNEIYEEAKVHIRLQRFRIEGEGSIWIV